MKIMSTADGVPFVRTSEAAFENLSGYPFAPQYVTF